MWRKQKQLSADPAIKAIKEPLKDVVARESADSSFQPSGGRHQSVATSRFAFTSQAALNFDERDDGSRSAIA